MDKNITLEPAFVLHTRAFRETSFIAELFTRNQGKIAVIAKGARRPKSKLKVIKTPSSLFTISCTGKGQLKTLVHCEIREYFEASPESYKSLFYVNELVSKFLEIEDVHQNIFDQYLNVCRSLISPVKVELEEKLRIFELILLREIGYGLDLTNVANSEEKIKEDFIYEFDPTLGFLSLSRSVPYKEDKHFKGQDILNLSNGDLRSSNTRKASKQIMRLAIDFHLGSKNINIREYFGRKGEQK